MPRVRAPASDASTTGSATSTRWRDSKPPDSSTRSDVSHPVTPPPSVVKGSPTPQHCCRTPNAWAGCLTPVRAGDERIPRSPYTRVVLVTLRLRFADRPEYELAFDVSDDVEDAWDLLRSRADDRGRVTLGDRDSCPI